MTVLEVVEQYNTHACRQCLSIMALAQANTELAICILKFSHLIPIDAQEALNEINLRQSNRAAEIAESAECIGGDVVGMMQAYAEELTEIIRR